MTTAKKLSRAQQRLLDEIKRHGATAEYWPVINDWLALDAGALAHCNMTRTVDALLRGGYITINDDGCFQLTDDVTPTEPDTDMDGTRYHAPRQPDDDKPTDDGCCHCANPEHGRFEIHGHSVDTWCAHCGGLLQVG